MENLLPIERDPNVEALQCWIAMELPALVVAEIKELAEYKGAADNLKVIKGRAKEIEALRKALTAPLDDQKKRIMDFFKPIGEALSKGEFTIKRALIAYDEQQERERLAEQRRREAELKAAQDKLAEQQFEAAMSGDVRAAEKAQTELSNLSGLRVAVPEVVQKVNGVGHTATYRAEVIDFALLPNEYKIPDQQALDRLARNTKGRAQVPGVVFHEIKGISARAL